MHTAERDISDVAQKDPRTPGAVDWPSKDPPRSIAKLAPLEANPKSPLSRASRVKMPKSKKDKSGNKENNMDLLALFPMPPLSVPSTPGLGKRSKSSFSILSTVTHTKATQETATLLPGRDYRTLSLASTSKADHRYISLPLKERSAGQFPPPVPQRVTGISSRDLSAGYPPAASLVKSLSRGSTFAYFPIPDEFEHPRSAPIPTGRPSSPTFASSLPANIPGRMANMHPTGAWLFPVLPQCSRPRSTSMRHRLRSDGQRPPFASVRRSGSQHTIRLPRSETPTSMMTIVPRPTVFVSGDPDSDTDETASACSVDSDSDDDSQLLWGGNHPKMQIQSAPPTQTTFVTADGQLGNKPTAVPASTTGFPSNHGGVYMPLGDIDDAPHVLPELSFATHRTALGIFLNWNSLWR